MPSYTIKVFLVHGDPKRLRTAEVVNWTIKAVAGPRSELDSVLERPEGLKPGVYFLSGVDPESGRPAVYIGEAESIRDRVRSHLGKDYWSQIIFVSSTDENLTKAHVKYLEGRLIEQAREANRALLKNGQGSGSRLPESDRADMEAFLSLVHQILPLLGVDVLIPAVASTEVRKGRQLLVCEIKGLRAEAYLSPQGVIVLKGSQAVLDERPSSHKYPQVLTLRRKLVAENVLARESGCYRFTQDWEFPSPSAAAAVIHGGSANGLTAWKDTAGTTLKAIEDKNLS